MESYRVGETPPSEPGTQVTGWAAEHSIWQQPRRIVDNTHPKLSINLQREGGQAKPYQVKQVRTVVLKYNLGDSE